MNDNKKPTIPLKEVPLDVRKYMLKIQGEIKEQKGISQYSLCQTVFKIIRDHREYYNQFKNVPNEIN